MSDADSLVLTLDKFANVGEIEAAICKLLSRWSKRGKLHQDTPGLRRATHHPGRRHGIAIQHNARTREMRFRFVTSDDIEVTTKWELDKLVRDTEGYTQHKIAQLLAELHYHREQRDQAPTALILPPGTRTAISSAVEAAVGQTDAAVATLH